MRRITLGLGVSFVLISLVIADSKQSALRGIRFRRRMAIAKARKVCEVEIKRADREAVAASMRYLKKIPLKSKERRLEVYSLIASIDPKNKLARQQLKQAKQLMPPLLGDDVVGKRKASTHLGKWYVRLEGSGVVYGSAEIEIGPSRYRCAENYGMSRMGLARGSYLVLDDHTLLLHCGKINPNYHPVLLRTLAPGSRVAFIKNYRVYTLMVITDSNEGYLLSVSPRPVKTHGVGSNSQQYLLFRNEKDAIPSSKKVKIERHRLK